MDQVTTTTFTVTIGTESVETVTLYHGSALTYCNAIATTGLNYGQMELAAPNPYAFCTSINFEIAKGYALLNPLSRQC
jgi:hypothetical protein